MADKKVDGSNFPVGSKIAILESKVGLQVYC